MAGRVYVIRRVHHVPLATMALWEENSPSRLEFRRGGTKDEVGKDNFSETKTEVLLDDIIYFKIGDCGRMVMTARDPGINVHSCMRIRVKREEVGDQSAFYRSTVSGLCLERCFGRKAFWPSLQLCAPSYSSLWFLLLWYARDALLVTSSVFGYVRYVSE